MRHEPLVAGGESVRLPVSVQHGVVVAAALTNLTSEHGWERKTISQVVRGVGVALGPALAGESAAAAVVVGARSPGSAVVAVAARAVVAARAAVVAVVVAAAAAVAGRSRD